MNTRTEAILLGCILYGQLAFGAAAGVAVMVRPAPQTVAFALAPVQAALH